MSNGEKQGFNFYVNEDRAGRFNKLRLGIRILCVIILLTLFFGVVSLYVVNRTLAPRLDEVEHASIMRNASLVNVMLEERLQNFSRNTLSFFTGEVSQSVVSQAGDKVWSVLARKFLATEQADLVAVFKNGNKVTIAFKNVDEPVVEELERYLLLSGRKELPEYVKNNKFSGYALLDGQPCAVISLPVEHSGQEYRIVAVNFIDSMFLRNLIHATGISLHITQAAPNPLGAGSAIANGPAVEFSRDSSFAHNIEVTVSTLGIEGLPPLRFNGAAYHDVDSMIAYSKQVVVKAVLIVSCIFILTLYFIFDLIFLTPLTRLYDSVQYIRKTGLRTRGRSVHGPAVFRELSQLVNGMVDIVIDEEAMRETMQQDSKAKNAFLGNMGREVREPLNQIISSTYMLQNTVLDYKQKDYVRKISDSASGMLTTAGDLLDFSLIESGQLILESLPFVLDELLEEVVAEYREQCRSKQLEFVLAVPPDIPQHLIGDRLRFGQVLSKLLSNAYKFTDEGEIFLGCSMEMRSAKSVSLHFVVRDSGIGMTPEKMSTMFMAFGRQTYPAVRRGRGIGLGLAMSKELVALMGGELNSRSVYGRGTSMSFTLRFDLPPVENQQPDWPAIASYKDLHVLVIEQNSSSRLACYDKLKGWQFLVETASGVDDATVLLQGKKNSAKPFDVVILGQPSGNFELTDCAKIHNILSSSPCTAFILCSPDTSLRLESLREYGVTALLPKPYTCTELYDVIILNLKSLFEPSLQKEEARIANFKGKRILLVEDNPVNEQIVIELLAPTGAELSFACTGKEAIKQVKSSKNVPAFDLVLMDIQMPEMDGVTATRVIRRMENTADMPIVAMTAYSMREAVNEYYAAGMNGHIPKPVGVQKLYDTLDCFLNHNPGASPSCERPENNTFCRIQAQPSTGQKGRGETDKIQRSSTCTSVQVQSKELVAQKLLELPVAEPGNSEAMKKKFKVQTSVGDRFMQNDGDKPAITGVTSGHIIAGNSDIPTLVIPDLPGFDVPGALRLINNNKKIYLNVLKRFYTQYSGELPRIKELFALGEDMEKMQREAHTLKGLAGTIGSEGLSTAASQLDSALKVNGEFGEEEVQLSQVFIAALDQTLSVLGNAFKA